MSDASRTTSEVTSTVYVKLVGDDQPCRWRNATIEEDYNGNIEVYRGERKIANFSARMSPLVHERGLTCLCTLATLRCARKAAALASAHRHGAPRRPPQEVPQV